MLAPQNGDRIVAMDSVTLLHPMYTRNKKIIKLDARQSKAKPNVSPPGCDTSRLHPAHKDSLRPATRMHYFNHRMLTSSTECHRNSVVWIKPTKIGRHGNGP